MLCIYLSIITGECARVCMGQCAYGSEGNLVASVFSAFL